MSYQLYYKGIASTPSEIGIICLTTNEIVCRIDTALPSGKDTRNRFNKMRNKLESKYHLILN